MIRVADSRADLERCVEICNAVEPVPVTIDMLKPGFLLHDLGGYAYVDRSGVPGSAYAMVRVHPDARRQGVGTSLLEAARGRARELGCDAMWGRVRDGESLSFVRRRGFEEVNRELNVLRELERGDGEVGPGIAELREEHLREAHEIAVECIPEIHVPQQGEAPPYEDWLAEEERHSPVAFVALDEGRVVGYARLYNTGLPHRLSHGLTAVRRTHRRRGLATALKRAQIAWAANHGYRELVSDMVEGNASIRGLNERLGYRPLPPVLIVSGSTHG